VPVPEAESMLEIPGAREMDADVSCKVTAEVRSLDKRRVPA